MIKVRSRNSYEYYKTLKKKKSHLIYQGTHVLSNEYFLTFSLKKRKKKKL